MRHYETLFILNPELTDEETAAATDKFSGILTKAGASVARVDNWGRRRLAFKVQKFAKGTYVLFEYGAESPAVRELERQFKIDDQVIRYLTVKKSEVFDPSRIEAAPSPKPADEDEPITSGSMEFEENIEDEDDLDDEED